MAYRTALFEGGTADMAAALAKAPRPLVVGLLFMGSITAFLLSKVIPGGLGTALGLVGGVSCGWSWLFMRALCRSPEEQRARWPYVIVGAMAALLVVIVVFDPGTGIGKRALLNVLHLMSSTVLLMTLVEIFRGPFSSLPLAERRYRQVLGAGYTALLFVGMVLMEGAAPGSVAAAITTEVQWGSAFVALVGGYLAMDYRLRHPLPVVASGGAASKPREVRTATADEAALFGRIETLLRADALHRDPALRVADLAARLGVPAYKVSRAIAAASEFSNATQLFNTYRIEEAKALLIADDRPDASILGVAMDCGFGSVGAFNRAFKAQVGVTPSDYRQQAMG